MGSGVHGVGPRCPERLVVGAHELSAMPLSVVTIAGGVNQALRGVLGADVLGESGQYVLDYENAHLWLGVRPY